MRAIAPLSLPPSLLPRAYLRTSIKIYTPVCVTASRVRVELISCRWHLAASSSQIARYAFFPPADERPEDRSSASKRAARIRRRKKAQRKQSRDLATILGVCRRDAPIRSLESFFHLFRTRDILDKMLSVQHAASELSGLKGMHFHDSFMTTECLLPIWKSLKIRDHARKEKSDISWHVSIAITCIRGIVNLKLLFWIHTKCLANVNPLLTIASINNSNIFWYERISLENMTWPFLSQHPPIYGYFYALGINSPPGKYTKYTKFVSLFLKYTQTAV